MLTLPMHFWCMGLVLPALGLLAACGGGQASGSAKLSTGGLSTESQFSGSVPSGEQHTRDMDPENLSSGSTSLELGNMRLKAEVCEGFNLTPEYAEITIAELSRFLSEQSVAFETEQARSDLHYFDLDLGGAKTRLRVATLSSPAEAANDLHQAVLEHGKGSWGVHRSNIAVLAPIAAIDDVIGLAVSTKLACWGMLTVAGRDDAFVVPGGYYEL